MPRPDPVSLLWDRVAPVFLERVYQAEGAWHGSRIANPGAAELAVLEELGADWRARDRSTAEHKSAPGGVNYRNVWGRAFARAVYRANKARGGPSIEIQIGQALPRRGVIPAGRAVRARTHTPAEAAARRQELGAEGYGRRRSDPALRNW